MNVYIIIVFVARPNPPPPPPPLVPALEVARAVVRKPKPVIPLSSLN